MKRLSVVSAVLVLLLVCSSYTLLHAAEGAGPGTDYRTIEPIPPPEEPERDAMDVLGDYLWNRFRDVADIVTLKLGWGTDKALGLQLRLIRPLQVGLASYEGYVFAIDRGCVGVMKEAELEGGFSVFYVGYIARKVVWQTDEAKKRNVFFGDVGEKGELSFDALKMYDDENQGWFTSTVQAQLPYLPKVELTVNWGEVPDLLLSLFGIDGLRVPPAFHKQAGPDGEKGERIPAPSIFWHGQEKYEKYD